MKYLFLFLLLSASVASYAQFDFFRSIKAKSISIESSSHSGSFRDPGFNELQNSARFGYLFDNPGTNYSWLGDFKDNSFNILINFRMKEETLQRHEFLAGIKKVNQKVSWLQTEGLESSQLKGRSELMKFVVGYRYYIIDRKFIRLSGGSQVDLGFTVSSFTKEASSFEEYEYFGHKGMQGGIEIPILIEIRLFKGALIYAGPALGLGYYSHDGLGQVISTGNITLGFRFKI